MKYTGYVLLTLQMAKKKQPSKNKKQKTKTLEYRSIETIESERNLRENKL